MASRKETNLRRQALLDELRSACGDGSLPMGEMLPSVRDLASRYSVSHRIVNEALQCLTEEGLLYAVPRKGTYVGRPHREREGLYLLVTENPIQGHDQLSRLQTGFEEQVSELGGTCLTFSQDDLTRLLDASPTLEPAGIMYLGAVGSEDVFQRFSQDCAWVLFSEQRVSGDCMLPPSPAFSHDTVYFDNESGGYQVTHYLLQQGHRNIAFLGLHGHGEEAGLFIWSRERAAGWRKALHESGLDSGSLLILPELMPENTNWIRHQEEIAREQAGRLIEPLRSRQISAVVTVNVHAAQGLMATLQASGLPADLWPVITTFGIGDANVSMMTSMLLPWEQMGRTAADLLWSRSHKTYSGAERHVAVPMRLITRLTCRPSWRKRPEAALWTSLADNQAVAAGSY